MKNLNVMFEDEEYERLYNNKKDRTWKEFIMLLINWNDEETERGN
jgi:hypothetical protein